MKIEKQIAFPDADRFMAAEVAKDGTYQIANLKAALKYVKNFTCAIDGGAHVGLWSRVMGRAFERVIAVEPSPDTFECLEWNLGQWGCANVEPRNVAIGDTAGTVGMQIDAEQKARANTGARFMRAGGTIPLQTIDSWALPSLGFLKLDIEGAEPMALRGAKDTLARCRPVVLFENKKLWTRHYGMPKDAVASFLVSLKYRMVESVACDQIWVAP